MNLTMKQLLWLEGKLRDHPATTAKEVLLAVRKDLATTAKRARDSRKDKVTPAERKAIDQYLATVGPTIYAPPVRPAPESMFGLSGHEILAKLGLQAPKEDE